MELFLKEINQIIKKIMSESYDNESEEEKAPEESSFLSRKSVESSPNKKSSESYPKEAYRQISGPSQLVQSMEINKKLPEDSRMGLESLMKSEIVKTAREIIEEISESIELIKSISPISSFPSINKSNPFLDLNSFLSSKKLPLVVLSDPNSGRLNIDRKDKTIFKGTLKKGEEMALVEGILRGLLTTEQPNNHEDLFDISPEKLPQTQAETPLTKSFLDRLDQDFNLNEELLCQNETPKDPFLDRCSYSVVFMKMAYEYQFSRLSIETRKFISEKIFSFEAATQPMTLINQYFQRGFNLNLKIQFTNNGRRLEIQVNNGLLMEIKDKNSASTKDILKTKAPLELINMLYPELYKKYVLVKFGITV